MTMAHRRHASAERLVTSHRTTSLPRDAAASQRPQVKLRTRQLRRERDLAEQIPWAAIFQSRSAASHAHHLAGVVVATSDQPPLARRSAEVNRHRRAIVAVDVLHRGPEATEGGAALRALVPHHVHEVEMREALAGRVVVAATRQSRAASVDVRATAVALEAPRVQVAHTVRALISMNGTARQRESDEHRRHHHHQIRSARRKKKLVAPRSLAGRKRPRRPHHRHHRPSPNRRSRLKRRTIARPRRPLAPVCSPRPSSPPSTSASCARTTFCARPTRRTWARTPRPCTVTSAGASSTC